MERDKDREQKNSSNEEREMRQGEETGRDKGQRQETETKGENMPWG